MTVIAATDFSKNSHAGLNFAASLANLYEEDLHIVHVVDFASDDNAWRVLYETTDEIEANARAEALKKLETLVEEAVDTSVSSGLEISFSVEFGEPSEGILKAADRVDAGLIVVGTVGESKLKHILFGRTSNKLVRQTTVPVLAVPPGESPHSLASILVAIDFSECSEHALETAASWAKKTGASLNVVHAIDINQQISGLGHVLGDIGTRLEGIVDDRTDALETMIKNKGLTEYVKNLHVTGSRPDDAIHEQGEAVDADLIVLGTHGRKGLSRWFLGSTAEGVLRSAKRPVLVVRNGKSRSDQS